MEKHIKNITEVYQYVNHSLALVEAKNGALVALNSGLIFGIFSLWDKLAPDHLFWFILAFVPALISLAASLASYYPLTQKKFADPTENVKEKDINLFRCESIALIPPSQLAEILAPDIDLPLIDRQRLSYIRKTSVVVARKYQLFRKSLWYFSAYGIYLLALLVFIIITDCLCVY
jgi:hypothetical protein